MTGRILRIPIPALALLCAVCGTADDNHGGDFRSTVRDSSGITIVDNGRPPPESRLAWQIGVLPSLSIGAIDSGGADQLFEVWDATRLPDGRIAIANSGSNELRLFNPDGSHAASWGRRGEGPGEFTGAGPTMVASWPGDSIAALNPWGLRLSLFNADGNHGRDVPLTPPLLDIIAPLPSGKILAKPSMGLRPDATGSSALLRQNEEWGILAPDGTRHASLGEHPGREWWARFDSNGRMIGGQPHPFSRRTMGAAWGDLVVIGNSNRYEIRAYGTDGSLKKLVRRRGEPGSPSRADLDAFYSRLYADLPDEQRTEALKAVRDMPLVESYPAFAEIVSDRVGYLWVREYLAPDAEGPVWTVFDPEGRVQGLVETPPGLRLFEIGEDYLLGRKDDDLGVEYVQLWPLSRSPA